jgi:hypothetical protein
MVPRGQNFKQVPLNIAGSSTFGRYPKINSERTYNMLLSDEFLVPYAGYILAMDALTYFNNAPEGRGLHTSTKLGKMIAVVGANVYLVDIFFDQDSLMTEDASATLIGTLQTNSGIVYIAENNKPQIAISDGMAIYIYDQTPDPSLSQPVFGPVPNLTFIPGFIDFHDTYFICAALSDTDYTPPANNSWRLSESNQGYSWPNDAAHQGLLQTKPDNIQAVVRFPSRGNLVFVMGNVVTEAWMNVGYQLFPYQRNNSYSIDYGCLNPATIASTDEIVCWLAQNEKSGPIIMYSKGQMPEKITTDGIDYLFSQLEDPGDSQAFIYRQDGHLIYHINFYTDNLSLFYDFNTQKFFHACDENLNYFIASSVAFFNNQYYFLTKNSGNLYAFDTIYTTYDGNEIPRFRICKNIRMPTQEYFVVNDVGFTIEQGETNYQPVDLGPLNIITENGLLLLTEDGLNNLITEQDNIYLMLPRVDLSISTDGGASFGSDMGYTLNQIGNRKNKIQWWQIGLANDFVCQFKFWGLGRFVATDGIVNIRQ